MPVELLALLLWFQPQGADPVELFRQGRASEAESLLKSQLASSPGDPRTVMLLAMVLDAQKRFEEAEQYHRRATKAASQAPQVWNNFGNHWLARQRLAEARQAFERAVTLDAAHPNANLQLARIAVEQNRAAAALPYLDRVGAKGSSDPAILALYGRALAARQDYAGAESVFAAALERSPEDFDLRMNLGLAALNANHADRALKAFEVAARRQPANAEAQFGLARAFVELGQIEPALGALAEARRLDPKRDDVLALLARTASLAGFHADAAQTWDEYLKLKPGSDVARRERAFALVRAGDRKSGLPGLEEFVARNPKDPVGHFELGIAHSSGDLPKAILHLGRSIDLKPDFAEALHARGALYAQDGKPEQAVSDLERAVKLTPDNAKALDRLGRAYRTLGRSADAERVLRRAVELDPNDGPSAMHLALALRDLGNREESQKYFAKFKELGGEERQRVPRQGLLEYLSLGQQQRREHYLANMRKAVEDRPDNEDLRLRLGTALIEENKIEEAGRIFATLTSKQRIEQAGAALVDAGRYEVARDLLERIPEAERGGEYWLARAHILLRQGDLKGASRLLDQAATRLPEHPQVQLDRAIVLELTQRFEEAREVLAGLQRRWPEWSRPWVVHGISFMTRGKASEALPYLEKAIALGDDSPEAHFYLADALISLSPDNRDRARREVTRALEISPDDPYALALAGRLDHESGDYAKAEASLKRSIELVPNLTQAHYQLMRVYTATGRKAEALAQSEIIKRLRSEGRDIDQQATATLLR